MDKKEDKSSREDSIEIPVGKTFGKLRENPWILSTIALAVVLIALLVIFYRGSGNITGNVISSEEAGKRLIDFINAQTPEGSNVSIVSSERVGSLYQVTVNYQGQNIPVFVTLDGSYLVPNPVPLSLGNLTENMQNSPSNQRVDVFIGDSPAKGIADAPVTIVEFSDFQCPFCKRFYAETYKQIIRDYVDNGIAKLYFKDFPLDFHENAQKAAEAARCVREQKGDSAYFLMHDKLFENQENLSLDNYKKWAREIGVDGARFDKCLDEGKFASAVKADLDYGQSIGVTGTPAFFINGVPIIGAQPYSVFQRVIEAELEATKEI